MPVTLLPLARTAAAGVALALLLGGCGSTRAPVASGTVALAIDEYHVSPVSVRVYAGALRIRLRNDGVLAHTLTVESAGGGVRYATIGTLFPHHTATSATFVLGPGSYRVVDTTANYAVLGAYGTILVIAR